MRRSDARYGRRRASLSDSGHRPVRSAGGTATGGRRRRCCRIRAALRRPGRSSSVATSPRPFAGRLLADLGATVVKVEDPAGATRCAPGRAAIRPYSPQFAAYNHSKSAITLDLRAARRTSPPSAAWRPTRDMLLENFRPGVMARLGVAPDTLLIDNPRLISASVTGFGSTGPYADQTDLRHRRLRDQRPVQRAAPARSRPSPVGPAMSDLLAGLFAAQGVLAALQREEASGPWADSRRIDARVGARLPRRGGDQRRRDRADRSSRTRGNVGRRPTARSPATGGRSWCISRSPTSSGRRSATPWNVPTGSPTRGWRIRQDRYDHYDDSRGSDPAPGIATEPRDDWFEAFLPTTFRMHRSTPCSTSRRPAGGGDGPAGSGAMAGRAPMTFVGRRYGSRARPSGRPGRLRCSGPTMMPAATGREAAPDGRRRADHSGERSPRSTSTPTRRPRSSSRPWAPRRQQMGAHFGKERRWCRFDEMAANATGPAT